MLVFSTVLENVTKSRIKPSQNMTERDTLFRIRCMCWIQNNLGMCVCAHKWAKKSPLWIDIADGSTCEPCFDFSFLKTVILTLAQDILSGHLHNGLWAESRIEEVVNQMFARHG